MWLLFLDDSEGRIREDDKKVYSLGGFCVKDTRLASIRKKFSRIKSKYGVPPMEEIKWSPPQGSWMHDNLVRDDRRNCWQDIFSLLQVNGAILLVSAVACYDDKDTAIKKCLEFIVERFEYILQKQNRDYGLVLMDRCSRTTDRECQEEMKFWLELGTLFVMLKLQALNVVPVDSLVIEPIQIADLVVGATTSKILGRGGFAEPHWDKMKSMFDTDKNGRIRGCGVKLFPAILESQYDIMAL